MRRAALALALVALGTAARAQTAQPTEGMPPPEPSPEVMETARRLFREGVEASQQARWDDARDRFLRTLQLRPAPIVRFNLAVAYENVGNLLEAVQHYRTFVREAPASDVQRIQAATRQVEALSPRLARLRVTVSGDEVRAFRLDGRAQPAAMLDVEITVNPGPHTVEVDGAAGDRQRHEGTLFEGEFMRVPVELTRTPAIASTAARDWRPRTQSFGHWVARPGPGGRWIDWAARATAPAPSVWRERPFTLALQLGAGAPTGTLSLSARYFPQPWFGGELAVGILGAYGPSVGLAAHARIPTARWAFGLTVGLAAGTPGATTTCLAGNQSATCRATPSASNNAYALLFSTGLTVEWRPLPSLSVRAGAGLRLLTNPSDLRALGDLTQRPTCAASSLVVADRSPCDIYRDPDAQTANPYATLDVGWAF